MIYNDDDNTQKKISFIYPYWLPEIILNVDKNFIFVHNFSHESGHIMYNLNKKKIQCFSIYIQFVFDLSNIFQKG